MTAQYPRAVWVPAAHVNYTRVNGTRSISMIVIHITDGPAMSPFETARWFSNPNQRNRRGNTIRVSAHYIVGREGQVVQCVRHEDRAHHAGRANAHSIGIEHVVRSGLRPTPMQYETSARLVKWLCDTLSIPMRRENIKGHAEADPTTSHRGCPNKAWDWAYYMVCLSNSGQQSFGSMIKELAAGANFAPKVK